MPIYNGFSTYNRSKKFRLSDFELAKQDLFNHLHIRKGEKLMNPKFGTIIWDMLFEPLTEEVKTTIADDLNTIVSYDPRLTVNSLKLTAYQNGIQVAIELTFVQTNQRDLLKMNFDRGSKA
jgi:phage baseplate assembly protein W